jgi:hypothetical protein
LKIIIMDCMRVNPDIENITIVLYFHNRGSMNINDIKEACPAFICHLIY